MTKQEALSKAADAVQMRHLALALYGKRSQQYKGAHLMVKAKYLLAIHHGATDADLQTLEEDPR